MLRDKMIPVEASIPNKDRRTGFTLLLRTSITLKIPCRVLILLCKLILFHATLNGNQSIDSLQSACNSEEDVPEESR